ncbi:hypothetical protein P879_05480 [Paragonimus westermani]|uniref:NADH dehydrogenase [ubiquinone] 1 subunit C2 n=1 Tax=Paragonimus westermani TaxID=34504 RepID=A0A8T0DC99_9TREM|nr:hypothetical protein P879_05480 [Paragonimus westermani]
MLAEILAGFGSVGSLSFNYYFGRPLYAQLYRTLGLGAGGYGIGYGIEYLYARRKHVHLHAIEHYKSMFPDRVPQKNIQTFNDVIDTWIPKR